MANRQVFTLDIETSGLISGYRKAIAAMEQAGAKSSITSGLTKSLDRLEEKFRNLENEGAFGKESSREIQNYQKRVDNAFSSLGQLGKELERISKNSKTFPTSALAEFERKLDEAKKKVSDLQKSFSGQFEKLGFSQEASNKLAETIKSEEDVKKALEDELKLRQQIEQSLKAAAVEAQRQAGRSVTSSGVGQSPLTNTNVDSSWAKKQGFSSDEIKQITQDLNKMFADGIRRGEDFATIWDTGIKNSILGSEEQLNHFVVDVEALKTRIEETIKKRDELSSKSSAVAEYEEAVRNRAAIGDTSGGTINFSSDAQAVIDSTTASLQDLQNASAQVTAQEQQRTNAENQNAAALRQVTQSTQGLVSSTNQARTSFSDVAQGAYETASAAEKSAQSFDNMKNRILMLLSATSVFNLLKRTIRETYEDVKTLDKSFASIAMVTKYSVNEMWSQYSKYADMAADLGQKTDSVIQASALFYQQGLDTNEAIELTTDTMKLATLAGNDFQTATQEMTSALRGFKMEMDEGGHVTDVYSELAAHAAASVDDIAQAMARTASIANSAGMSFENTSVFLTQMIETTQESAENIGTSLKTIIARFTELKENVAGTSDSEFSDLDYNKVDKALKSVGVSLKDANGQFRDLDQVFLELSGKWESLDRNTQRYVATIAAGSRQQSRFIAMMDNYDRTVELMDLAADAEGKADEQFAKYADTMEYKLNQLNTKWEEFRVQALNSDFFKGLTDGLSNFLNRLQNIDFKKALVVAPAAIWAAKNFISNFLIGFKKNIGQFRALGKEISNALSKDKPKIDIQLQQQLVKNQIAELTTQLSGLTNKPHLLELGVSNANAKDMVAQYRAEIQSTTGAEISWKDAVNQLAKELGVETGALNTNYAAIKKKQQEMQETNRKYNEAVEQQRKLDKQQQKSALTMQATSAAVSAATMSLSGFISGAMSGSEALKTFALQLGISAAQMLLSATITSVTSGIKVAAAKAEEGAWWATFAAETAATMGAALLVVGVMAAVAAVALLFAWLVKQGEEAKKAASASEQLAEANKDLEKAKTKKAEANSTLKNLETEKKNVEDITKEYDELSKKRVKTTDDQERMQELAEQIKSDYPELIRFEDEETGILSLYLDLQNEKLKKLDEEIEKQKQIADLAAVEELRAQTAVDDYTGLRDIEKATGITIDASEESRDFKRMTSGELQKGSDDKAWSYVSNGDGTGYYEQTAWGKQLTDFAEKLTDGGKDLIKYGEEASQELVDAWNYVMSGQGTVADEFKDAAEEMRASVQEAAKAFDHFTDILDVTENISTELYGDKSETEQEIRAIFKADEANDKETSWTDLKKSKAASDYDSASDHYEWMMKQFGLEENEEAKALVNGASDLYYDVAEWASGNQDDWEDVWSDLNTNARDLANTLGITDQASYEEFFGGTGTKDTETFRIIEKALYDKLNETYLKEKAGYEAASDELISQVTSMQMDFQDRTIEEGLGMWQTLEDQIAQSGLDEEGQDKIRQLANETTSEELTNLKNNISTIYGEAAEGIKISTAQMLQEAYNSVVESGVLESSAQKLVDKQLEILRQNKVKEDDWAAFMQIDWSAVTDPASFKTFKESQIELMKEQGVTNAEVMFDEMAKAAEQYGALDIDIDTELELDNFIEQLDEMTDKIEALGDSVIDSVKDMTENGEVSFKTFQEALKNLSELGLNAYDYYDVDASGKITTDQEKLNKLYQDQLKAGEQQLIQERNKAILKKSEVDLQIKQIEAQISSLKNGGSIVDMEIDMNNTLQPVLSTWVKIAKVIAEIQGKTFDESQFQTRIYAKIDAEKTQETINALKEQLDPLKTSSELLGDTITAMNQEIADRDKYNAAAIRDFNQRMLEAQGTEKDVTKATEDHAKALDDLQKAQEDVIDKQEALNEKLKEYNDLLYGSENRKSSLDYLYNYDEAINSFNDEISRSKDLLADAKSIEDSTTALQRYANATHNLIAEETAKQQVIQAGLKNYADMIENGSYAYTNRETGQTTNINFGDYARKDSRTGKYVIDQRLINESKFTDEIKDLLEEQVSNYNKYSDELLKSEDNIRKAEKELQDQRKTALKNYAAMETEIAEALKAQYQEEVNALKDKYDAMKDADDDYLDALQDAIDKQRQLRDRENKYEDLAQKEKKLSLMQRDTSGANELETRQLEKEVQQDRESLLDEAIDEVIDGLSELYESQQELRDSEMELKEALLDNTLYWNTQAEGLAGSFESAEDYAQFLSSLSEEYSMMTLAQQQVKLQEYGETYTAASEYMAMQAMDSASETGDFIIDTMTITGDEVGAIVAETAETFSTEVIRSYNETTAAFEEDMRKAEESIDSAKEALQEAINKLNECAAAANTAAQALRDAQAAQATGGTGLDIEDTPDTTYVGPSSGQLVDWFALKDTMDGMGYSINNNGSVESGTIAFGANSSTSHGQLASYIQKLYRGNELEELQQVTTALGLSTTDGNSSTPLNSYQLYNKIKERLIAADASLTSVFKYKEGGLVNYTGPAWVDGSPDRPEAFLDSEDTARIGEAAKILADIPWMDRDTDNASVVTNNGGDVSVEINLNIDHISSDTDIDEMIQRVKDEIVDVARPEGTNVILQQQLN